jgi:positive phototaxis protein PixI
MGSEGDKITDQLTEQLSDLSDQVSEPASNQAIAASTIAQTLTSEPEDPDADPNLVDYIQLHLNNETWAALEMLQVDAVISVNAKSIVPIPNMPSCFLGLFNHRGHVYWVIDLPHLLGISPLEDSNSSYAAMIVTPQHQRSSKSSLANSDTEPDSKASKIETASGRDSRNDENQSPRSPLILAVKEIEGIVKFLPEQIQACIPPIPPGLQAYTKQCLDSDREKLYILDIEAIANAAILRA